MRKTDGSPAKRLGDGAAIALSPDGKWVIAVVNVPRQTILLPTGAGETRRLERPGIEDNGDDSWFADGTRVIFTGRESGKLARTFTQDISGGAPRAVTPEGITGTIVSPDGTLLLATNTEGRKLLFPLAGGAPPELRGLADDDRVMRWAADGHSLYVYKRGEMPLRIYRLNYSSGARELLKVITPSDPAGMFAPPHVFITPDGKSYLYQFQRDLSALYLIDGLIPRRGFFGF